MSVKPTKCFSQRASTRCSFIQCCQSGCSLLGCCGESMLRRGGFVNHAASFLASLVSARWMVPSHPMAPRFSGACAEPSRPRWPVVCEVVFVGLTTALRHNFVITGVMCEEVHNVPMDRSDDAHAALLVRSASGG